MNWEWGQGHVRREQAGWQRGSGFLSPRARPVLKRRSLVALWVLPFVPCSTSFTSMNPSPAPIHFFLPSSLQLLCLLFFKIN